LHPLYEIIKEKEIHDPKPQTRDEEVEGERWS